MWIEDRASFVDVTLGASRLQAVYRESGDEGHDRLLDRTIPLGQSVLMVVPDFEQHSLGAFSAADQLRRYGLWVRMAIGLDQQELGRLVNYGGFSMVGLTVGSSKTLEHVTGLIDYLRANVSICPPISSGAMSSRMRGRSSAGPARITRCGRSGKRWSDAASRRCERKFPSIR